MPRLFESTIEIEKENVAVFVLANWNMTLGVKIKGSQNHTFKASRDGVDYAVRVTPDPLDHHLQRIMDELTFVQFVANEVSASSKDNICAPIHSLEGNLLECDTSNKLIVCAFSWAKGVPLVESYASFRWMLDSKIVFAWGRFFAELHQLSRQFSSSHHSAVAARIQTWEQVHDGVLLGAELHADDEVVKSSEQHYGIIHGDLNVSNFFWIEETLSLSVEVFPIGLQS